MRKLVLIGLGLFLFPLALPAQEIPQVELFWGYSLLRTERTNWHGWNFSAAANLNKNLALVTDVSGNYGSSEERITNLPSTADLTAHTFTVGPRVSEARGRWVVFAHALVGVTRLTADADVQLPSGPPLRVSDAEVAFAGFFGGGLDAVVSPSIALRLIQADYFVFRGDTFKNEGARIGVGLVFRWGKKGR